MTEEEYEERLELIRLTSGIMDNRAGAHQQRWDNMLNQINEQNQLKTSTQHWQNLLNQTNEESQLEASTQHWQNLLNNPQDIAHTLQQSDSKKAPVPQGYAEGESYQITFVLDQDIPIGDPEGHAIRLFARALYKQVDNFDISEEAAQNAAMYWNWQGTFGPYRAGSSLTVKCSEGAYLYGLKLMYGQKSAKVADFIEGFVNSHEEKHLKHFYHLYLERWSRLTDTEIEYFEQWCQQKDLPAPLSLVSYEQSRFATITRLNHYLQAFGEGGGLALLGDQTANDSAFASPVRDKDDAPSLQEDYLRKGDETKEIAFEEMLISFASVSPKLLDKYLKGELKEDAFVQHLGKSDLKLKDLDRFKRLYRYKTLQSAFELLAKNEELVHQEMDRYSDPEQLNKLVNIIKGKNETFESTRVNAAKFFSRLFGQYRYSMLHFMAKKSPENQKKTDQFNLMLAGLDEETRDLFTQMARGNGLVSLRQLPYPVLVRLGAITAAYIHTYDAVVAPKEKVGVDGMGRVLAQANTLNNELQTAGIAHDFLVLRDATFDFSQLARFNKAQIGAHIVKGLQRKKENIATVRADLNSNPDYVWELQPLIAYTAQKTAMAPGSAAGKVILDKTRDVAFYQNLQSIGLGALSLVLAVGGIFSGGITTWLGSALMAGSIGLGAYDVYSEVRKYQKGKSVSDTALEKAEELGNLSVNELGVVLAVAGLVLDTVDLIKGIRLINKANKFNENAREAGLELYEELKGNKSLLQGVSPEEFVDRIEVSVRETAALHKSKNFAKLLKIFDGEQISEVTKLGLYRMSRQKNTAEVMAKLANHPEILKNMAHNVLADIHQLEVYEAMAAICLKKDLNPAKMLGWVTKGGRRHGHFLPGVLNTLKNEIDELPKGLLENIFGKPKFMSIVVANPDNPGALRKTYQTWVENGGNGTMTGFERYLANHQDFKRFFDADLGLVARTRRVETLTEQSFATGSLSRKHQEVMVTKLIKKQIDEDDIRWLNQTLQNPQLDEISLNIIQAKLDRTSTHLKSFITKVQEQLGSGDINEVIQAVKGDETVAQALSDLGIDFGKLQGAKARNLAVYGTTEPALAKLFGSDDISKYLPPNVVAELNTILNTNTAMVAKTLLGNVRPNLVKSINELLGKSLNISDIRQLDASKLINQQGSRGSVLEHWVAHNASKSPAYSGKSLKGGKSYDYTFGGKTGKVRLDNHYYQNGEVVAIEIKNISGKFGTRPLYQLRRYADMVATGELKRVEYIFESEKVAGLNRKEIIKAFQRLDKRTYKIYYIDDSGKIQPLK